MSLFTRIDTNLDILAAEIEREHPESPFAQEIFVARFDLGHRYLIRELARLAQQEERQP